MGKKKIDQFIKAQNNRTVFCHGQSLGGSLCMRTAARHRDSRHAVYSRAHVPAGTTGSALILSQESTVIISGQDTICLLGNLPRNATYYYCALDLNDDRGKNPIRSHASPFAFYPNSQISKVDHSFFKKGRVGAKYFINFLYLTLGVIFVNLFLLIAKIIDVVANTLMTLTGIKWAISNDRRKNSSVVLKKQQAQEQAAPLLFAKTDPNQKDFKVKYSVYGI